MKKQVSAIAFALGLGTLSFIFLTVTLTSIAFLFHGAVSPIWLLLSVLGSGYVTYWILAKNKTPRPWLWVVVLLAIFGGSVALASPTMDSTWDGNDYHKTAIGEMKNGWNPVWQQMQDFDNSSRNPLHVPGENNTAIDYMTNWTNHYPKATWIFAANIYKVTGNIESGKAITLLSMVVVFCFVLSYFYAVFGRNKTLIIALLLTFNPVVLEQVFNYYNDGVLGNLLIALILLFTMLLGKQVKDRRQQVVVLAAIGMAIVLLANIKFNGLAYAAIVAVCYYVYFLARRNFQLVKYLTVTGIVSLVLGILVVGASSYVVNMYRNHNPLFPLAGKGKIDIMVNQEPVTYQHQSGIHKFIASNLLDSTADLSRDPNVINSPPRKLPFTINMSELTTLDGTSDARQGGYGVWFGGILIVSIIAAAYLLIRYGRKYKEYLAIIFLPLISIGITVLAFDNTWWARYLPQLILFPVIVVVLLFALRSKTLVYAIIFALFFNATLTGFLELSAQQQFRTTSEAAIAANLQCNPKKQTLIGYGRFYGALYNIWDACHNIRILTNQQTAKVPSNKITQLYEGVYEVTE